MKLFLDSASLEEAERWNATGLVSGVTTNPTIIAKTAGGRDPLVVLENLAEIFDCVSVQLRGPEDDPTRYLAIPGVVVKAPLVEWGLRLVGSVDPARLNITGITSRGQAIAAATIRPRIASVFWNRMKEAGTDPAEVVFALEHALAGDERASTWILAGSIRSATDVFDALRAGVDVVTCSPKVLEELLHSPATEKILAEWYGGAA